MIYRLIFELDSATRSQLLYMFMVFMCVRSFEYYPGHVWKLHSSFRQLDIFGYKYDSLRPEE